MNNTLFLEKDVYMGATETSIETIEKTIEQQLKKLVVHNDEKNTFEWVIDTLMEVCKHTEEQAEQSSYIIHNKGKYAVKLGSLHELKPMKDAITDRGINATIEK